MISVMDLRGWAEEHAIGRSASYPHGWIKHEDLIQLAYEIQKKYPLEYYYSRQTNYIRVENNGKEGNDDKS